MARPIKTGIDYYPLDVDFLQDIKVRKIMKACGIQSITILISLLSSIYRDEGYYVGWDSDMSFLVADEVGTSEGAVLEFVNKAVQVDFFDEELFKKYKIVTSAGIQKRYLEAVKRRKSIELIEEYFFTDLLNGYSNLVNVSINSINTNRSTQRIVKDSIEKDSIVSNIDHEENEKIEDSKTYKLSEIQLALIKDAWNSFETVKINDIQVGSIEHKAIENIVSKHSFEDLTKAISNIDKSSYLKGEINGKKISFDWFIVYENFLKVLGGQYSNKPKSTKKYDIKASPKTKFHNFEQRSDKYSEKELELIARRKREAYIKSNSL